MSDTDIEFIFVEERARECHSKGLVFPPKYHRYTVKQIREQFTLMRKHQRDKILAEEDQ